MKVILTFIILMVCGVCNSYGDTTAIFMINTTMENFTPTAYCEAKPKKVTLEEGSEVWIATSNYYHIQKTRCHVPNHPEEFDTPKTNEDNKDAWYLRLPNVSVNQSGWWCCELKFGGPSSSILPNDSGFTSVHCKIYVTVNKRKIPEPMKLPFSIRTIGGIPKCTPPDYISPIEENQKLQVIVNSDKNFTTGDNQCFIDKNNDSTPTETFLTLRVEQDPVKIHSEEKTFSLEKSGKNLTCKVKLDIKKPDFMVTCSVRLFVKGGAVEESRSAGDGDISNITIIIIVGVIVILIILGQSVALLYFKSRAQVRNRLDTLVTQDRHFNRNDEVRYSAPPGRRNTKTNRAAAETDSHIYEMVGVNALYKDSSELDIKNRPPLPLPGESPVPPPVPIDTLPRPPKSKLMSSTLSLNSISSKPVPAKPVKKELPPTPVQTPLNKAPCRPPKPADVDILTGSLPRPPKPGSLPRPPKPGTSLPRPPKPGSSMPKMLPSDPGLLELKKALEKRNVKNAASPSPSQQSTLEMKKTRTITPPPPTFVKPAKTPVGAVNPLTPNMKLVMPKIEASLKPAKPEAALNRATETIAGGPSIQPVKPGVPPFRRPNPEANASSTVAPLMPPQTQTKSRPLPPIHTEEDERHYSDDDEWTYEQLEKYNIYNV